MSGDGRGAADAAPPRESGSTDPAAFAGARTHDAAASSPDRGPAPDADAPPRTLPAWSLRVLFAALALPLALTTTPGGFWPAVAVALTALTVAVPRWRAGWLLIAVLAFSALREPGVLTPRLLALVAAVHALHILASWMLALPAAARLQPAVLLPSLRRFLAIQVPVQAVAVVVLLVAHPVAPWLAVVSGAAILGLVALLAVVLLVRPRD